ncbi:hypothetical protein [Aestuariispira insulae]|uniref:Lipoprotein n=1 Tax=Aestuariispira insulae TaxID=1461337 RepID=A0A3D9HF44_9PROT|nr:hypothetical protein [Aestuariispira insulae]RED48109.1 hypothetical protein DFP90_108128 [Aestuariispira insulae]
MKKIVSGLVGLFALAGLSACETAIDQPQYADLTFGHLGVIELNVAEIKVIKAYQPSPAAPHVELEFPVSPLETAARWATDRLKATGTRGVATVTISDASVVETALKTEDGLTGAFTTDQSERYDGTIEMKIVTEDPSGTMAETTTVVRRSTTVPEDVSLNERSDIWYDFTEQLMTDLDRQLVTNIKTYLKGFTY